ncbi:MAG: sugar phosphate isomerase/epimerase family protein [Planctomycetota bacterium]
MLDIKLAMCNEFCEGWSFEDACALAADAGYEGIEIAPFTIKESVEEITQEEQERVRQIAGSEGLEVAGLHWLLASPEGLYLTHPDNEVREWTQDYLRAEIDFCASIGGDRLILGSPDQRNVLEDDSYEAAWDRAVEVFSELAPHAEERGVILCIEPLAPAETNFITSAADARRMVDAVDHPGFKMMLDVKAMCGDVEPIPDIIRKSAGYVEHFHANDESLGGPGSGQTDFEPIVQALDDIDYAGWVSVEVFDFSPGAEAIARGSICYLQDVFQG